MAKRPKPGDVIIFEVPEGCVFLQYLGRHAVYGDSVLVCPEFKAKSTEVSSELFSNAYPRFYPLLGSVSRGLSKIVGHLPCLTQVPVLLRRPAVVLSDGRIEAWVIVDSHEEIVKKKLNAKDLQIPLSGMVNHEYLAECIRRKWRPEKVNLSMSLTQPSARTR